MHHLLNLLIWLPILGGVFVLLTGDDKNPSIARYLTLFTVILSLLLCIPLVSGFNLDTFSMQYIEEIPWMPSLGINYSLGIDGLSLLLILLSIFTNLIVVLATWDSIKTKIAQYMASFLIMQGLLVGVFSAMDAIVFYVFFEATLVPMYLIIGIWGSDNRVYAALKFFLYTFLGSVLLISYLSSSSEIPQFYGSQKFVENGTLTPTVSRWIGTGLIATYILSGLAFVAFVWSSVSRLFK